MTLKSPKNPCYPSDKIEQLPSGEWVSRDADSDITARWNADAEKWERCGPLKSRPTVDADLLG